MSIQFNQSLEDYCNQLDKRVSSFSVSELHLLDFYERLFDEVTKEHQTFVHEWTSANSCVNRTILAFLKTRDFFSLEKQMESLCVNRVKEEGKFSVLTENIEESVDRNEAIKTRLSRLYNEKLDIIDRIRRNAFSGVSKTTITSTCDKKALNSESLFSLKGSFLFLISYGEKLSFFIFNMIEKIAFFLAASSQEKYMDMQIEKLNQYLQNLKEKLDKLKQSLESIKEMRIYYYRSLTSLTENT